MAEERGPTQFVSAIVIPADAKGHHRSTSSCTWCPNQPTYSEILHWEVGYGLRWDHGYTIYYWCENCVRIRREQVDPVKDTCHVPDPSHKPQGRQ